LYDGYINPARNGGFFYCLALTYRFPLIAYLRLSLYPQGINTDIKIIFPAPGTNEDNLKPRGRVYRFNAECYKATSKAIKIWKDIWLPKSEIKIVWGELQIDYVDVTLSVPKWLIKKTLLNDKLKVY